MSALRMFIPITKVDAARRLVYGLATAETEDRAGEICDDASTKPLYEKWSEEIAKSTRGKSFGNLRAMHGTCRGGESDGHHFQRRGKADRVRAKVVDDAEWAKVVEGSLYRLLARRSLRETVDGRGRAHPLYRGAERNLARRFAVLAASDV